jgi:hypothetical protein
MFIEYKNHNIDANEVVKRLPCGFIGNIYTINNTKKILLPTSKLLNFFKKNDMGMVKIKRNIKKPTKPTSDNNSK